MKKLKQFGSLLLALMLAVALSCPAFAAGNYTITIENDADGHTYEAYQIFAGDLKVEGKIKTLSNIKWGNGVTAEAQTKFGDAATKAETLKNASDAVSFADAVASCINTANVKESSPVAGGYKITGLDAGYYLVKDKDASQSGKDDSYTSYILQVVGDVQTKAKNEKPSMEKKVKDINDTTGQTTGWQDSADYDIGDEVPFQLKGIVAEDYANYTAYKFAFHDQESAGLTFNRDSVKVYVDGTEITDGYTVTAPAADGDTFDVVFEDLKSIASVKAKSVITVEYTSTLNENAKIGAEGNPNEAYLEYSNNPNDSQGGETGKTPKDKVIVFTYKTVVNKIDGSTKAALEGAAFKLEKKLANGGTTVVKEFTVQEGQTSFEFVGLDDGDYILTETVTPSGYNSIKPIEFSISATHDEEAADPQLKELKVEKTGFNAEVSTGVISTTVENNAGSTLPTTGGMGTTVLYVVGGALVVCAGVALVAKKRMQ